MLSNVRTLLSSCAAALTLIAFSIPASSGSQVAAPGRVEALEHAARLIAANDLAAADSALQPLLQQTGPDPLALNLLGFIRMQQQKTEQAETLFQRAVDIDPRIAGPIRGRCTIKYNPSMNTSASAIRITSIRGTAIPDTSNAARWVASLAIVTSRSGSSPATKRRSASSVPQRPV